MIRFLPIGYPHNDKCANNYRYENVSPGTRDRSIHHNKHLPWAKLFASYLNVFPQWPSKFHELHSVITQSIWERNQGLETSEIWPEDGQTSSPAQVPAWPAPQMNPSQFCLCFMDKEAETGALKPIESQSTCGASLKETLNHHQCIHWLPCLWDLKGTQHVSFIFVFLVTWYQYTDLPSCLWDKLMIMMRKVLDKTSS